MAVVLPNSACLHRDGLRYQQILNGNKLLIEASDRSVVAPRLGNSWPRDKDVDPRPIQEGAGRRRNLSANSLTGLMKRSSHLGRLPARRIMAYRQLGGGDHGPNGRNAAVRAIGAAARANPTVKIIGYYSNL